MCAAPGSKTTQIIDLLTENGTVEPTGKKKMKKN